MEFPCNKCGMCCRNIGNVSQLADFNDGTGICVHLTIENNCNIYAERPVWCNVARLYEEQYREVMTREKWMKINQISCGKLARGIK